MQIELKVAGKGLFSTVVKEEAQFPRHFRLETLNWRISYMSSDFTAEAFLCFSERPSVIVVDAGDLALLEKIQAMDSEIISFIKNNPELPLARAPIIVVFQSTTCLQQLNDFPDVVSDWMFMPIDVHELTRRALSALKRQKLLQTKLQIGPVTLIHETQSIAYEGRILQLPLTEFTLAEMFFSQVGVVIPFSDLISLFRSKGKSTKVNNIRVAIYQLRLKLAMLTKSHVTLTNVYKKGYCLRQKASRAGDIDTPTVSRAPMHNVIKYANKSLAGTERVERH